MDERLHQSLDGDLDAGDLTASERAARAAFEARVSRLRTDLDRRVPADIDAGVMRRIRDLGLEPLPAAAEPFVRRLARNAWAAREVRFNVRPAFGLAAAAVLAALLVTGGALLGDALRGPAQPSIAAESAVMNATQEHGAIYVQFRLDAGTASDVALVGSFTDWQPTEHMRQSVDGVWTLVLPLSPGVHDYAFVVDGERWVPDPYAPQVDDGFGGVNSRLTVLEPAERL